MVFVRTWIDELDGEISYSHWMRCPSPEVEQFTNVLKAFRMILTDFPHTLSLDWINSQRAEVETAERAT